MTDPTVTCVTCQRRRNVMLHQRADDPPASARAWMRRTCARFNERQGRTVQPEGCVLTYTAGFGVGGPAVGQ